MQICFVLHQFRKNTKKMQKKTFRIEIPKPCHENWSEMTTNEQGAFCKSCQKTVVDFSQLADNQIVAFVKNNQNGFCGRFTNQQLAQTFELPNEPKFTNTPMRWAAAGMIAASLLSQDTEANILEKSPTQIVDNQRVSLDLSEKFEGDSLKIIEGKVVDKSDNSPMPEITVSIDGTRKYTTTDANGNFKIQLEKDTDLLRFSLIGMKIVVISQNELQKNNFVVKMENDEALLGEVIIGCKTEQKHSATGGVTLINFESKINEKLKPEKLSFPKTKN